LIARALSAAGSLAGDSLVPDHIADVCVTITGADVFFLAVVEPELIFVQRANWNFDYAFAIREDDRFIGNDRAKVLLDRVADPLLVAVLVDLTFTLKRPVVSLNGHILTPDQAKSRL